MLGQLAEKVDKNKRNDESPRLNQQHPTKHTHETLQVAWLAGWLAFLGLVMDSVCQIVVEAETVNSL